MPENYRVLLLAPPPSFPVQDRPTHHPVRLLYTASLFAPETELLPLDAHFLQMSCEEIVQRIITEKAQVTLLFQEDHRRWIPLEVTKAILEKVRSHRFKNLLGVAATSSALHLPSLLAHGADFIIPQYPEFALEKLLEQKPTSLSELKGIPGIQQGNRFVALRSLPGEDNLLPSWDKLPYLSYPVPPFRIRKKPYLPLLSAYGCPYHCSFCPASETGWWQRGLDSVLREIEVLICRFGAKELHFCDATFGLDLNWTKALCQALSCRFPGVSWSCSTRVDVATEELLHALKSGGCYSILFGLESCSDEVLALNKKGFTRAQAEKTIKAAKKLGFEVTGTFLFGMEKDTPATALETVQWAQKLPLDFAIFSVMTLLTPELAHKFSFSSAESYNSAYIFKGKVHVPPSYSSAKALFKMQKSAYRRFYLRLPYLFSKGCQLFMPKYLERYKATFFFLTEWILKGEKLPAS